MFYHSPFAPATPAQLKTLEDLGLDVGGWISGQKADDLIKANLDKWRALPATAKQEWRLRRTGQWRHGMTRGEASDLLGDVKDILAWVAAMRR